MPEKTKTATASDPTVGSTLAKLSIENKELRTQNDMLIDDIKQLKRQLAESTAVIDTEIRAGFYQLLKGVTDFTQPELDAMSTEDLQKLCETFTRTKKDAKIPFMSIRAGGDSEQPGAGLTVGSLYGMKREDILKSAGEY